MRLGLVINSFTSLSPHYTCVHLAFEAHQAGHEVVLLCTDSFELRADGTIWAVVRHPAPGSAPTRSEFVRALQDAAGHLRAKIDLECLDVLLLRNNPFNADVLNFACRLKQRGVLVLNDPETLLRANSKMYLTGFPAKIQPRTLISKDAAEIKNFLRQLDGPAILKPLNGFGGENILYVRRRQKTNLNAYLESLSRVNGGYMVAQEYLPAARKGDKRLLLLDGAIIGGYNRLHAADDHRNNMHSGARARACQVTADDRRVCTLLRPRLLEDGLYLVGVDKVGGRILEVNVFAPGGIDSINLLTGSNLGRLIVDDLRRRVLRRRGTGPYAVVGA